MRIIGGKYKGKKLFPPKNTNIRPTTDRAKEGLFNILNNYFNLNEISILDLFSGSGAISFEFASRSAKRIVAIEKNFENQLFIQQTIDDFKLENILSHRKDALRYLKNCTDVFDIIFADPPYSYQVYEKIISHVFNRQLLSRKGFLIIEHDGNKNFNTHPKFLLDKEYGNVHFTFFEEKLNK